MTETGITYPIQGRDGERLIAWCDGREATIEIVCHDRTGSQHTAEIRLGAEGIGELLDRVAGMLLPSRLEMRS